MIEEFMTALQVILLQLSLPRDQRAKSDLFQSTWKLCCRDSHKTQVWLCFFTLSFLTSCASATPIKVGDLQTCLEKELKVTIEVREEFLGAAKGIEGIRFGGLRIASLLFADDVVLLAPSGRDLQLSLERFAAECEGPG
ncbi:interleukin-15 isoform X2 [Poeciliopsis prolifica]|uniref:interleukin-15 isoform X2 n=1 Tax=Poeciliopsis prolifica TaxID=188132 RepID=UPI00241438B5|nr:interleukin-15 isoform X2 [Poeciliopsis prolifica]